MCTLKVFVYIHVHLCTDAIIYIIMNYNYDVYSCLPLEFVFSHILNICTHITHTYR